VLFKNHSDHVFEFQFNNNKQLNALTDEMVLMVGS